MDIQTPTITKDGPYGEAIRNPGNVNHLMVIKPVAHRVRIYVGDALIADTTRALRVLEVGKTVYDPVLYVPVADLSQPLALGERSTHCPLKGDAHYASIDGTEIGWVYRTFSFSDRLGEHMGFSPSTVRIVEGQ